MKLFQDRKRIVIKIGSALLVDQESGTLRHKWLESLAQDVNDLIEGGKEVILVSSGSIALGRRVLGLTKDTLNLEESQAAASIGQIILARNYADIFEKFDKRIGQILLIYSDTEERRRYLNARATISTLLKLKAIPIINENDSVATAEIRFGDNDRLSARVASMISADTLILLSDINGLYSAPPEKDQTAIHIPTVKKITPEIEAMAGGSGSIISKGGMTTKLEAAKIATHAGTEMYIANGQIENPINAIINGAPFTLFEAQSSPLLSRKKWILGTLEPLGVIWVDEGAEQALQRGKSLLPAGVVKASGTFARGDAITVKNNNNQEIGRGLINYDYNEALRILGQNSSEIENILGYKGRSVLIHRDNLVLLK